MKTITLAAAVEDPITAVANLNATYILSDRDEKLRQKFDLLLKTHGASRTLREIGAVQNFEAQMLAVYGETGAGKTSIVENLISSYPEFAGHNDISNGTALINIRAPASCTPKRLARALLDKLGFPLRRDWPEHRLWEEVAARLKMHRIDVVHIDEMQHASHVANEKEIRRLGATLKGLLVDPEWPVTLVVAGVPSLLDFLKGYPELQRRTVFFHVTDLEEEDAGNMAGLAAALCAKVGLDFQFAACADFGERLLHAANRQFGSIIEWTRETIRLALHRRELDTSPSRLDPRIDINDFAAAYEHNRSCRPVNNIFLTPHWREIDPMTGTATPPDETPPGQRRRNPSKRANSHKGRNY